MVSGCTTVPILVLVRTSPLAVSTLTASRTADRPEPSSMTSAASVGQQVARGELAGHDAAAQLVHQPAVHAVAPVAAVGGQLGSRAGGQVSGHLGAKAYAGLPRPGKIHLMKVIIHQINSSSGIGGDLPGAMAPDHGRDGIRANCAAPDREQEWLAGFFSPLRCG